MPKNSPLNIVTNTIMTMAVLASYIVGLTTLMSVADSPTYDTIAIGGVWLIVGSFGLGYLMCYVLNVAGRSSKPASLQSVAK